MNERSVLSLGMETTKAVHQREQNTSLGITLTGYPFHLSWCSKEVWHSIFSKQINNAKAFLERESKTVISTITPLICYGVGKDFFPLKCIYLIGKIFPISTLPCLSGHGCKVEYWCQRQLISLKIHTLL